MRRPCFLVIDPENAASISSRKLVIEAAQMNVITAYSHSEGIVTLRRFPDVDGVILNVNSPDNMSCDEFIRSSKQIRADLPIVAVRNNGPDSCDLADHHVESFDPAKLLNLVRSIVDTEARAIEQRQNELGGVDA